MCTLTRPRVTVVGLVVSLAVVLGMLGGATGVQAGTAPSALQATLALSLSYHWHTFYDTGDVYVTERNGVAVDAAGNVIVAGFASASWGSPLHAHSGDRDVVVMKLNSLGVYQWHTFYGAPPSSGEDGDDEALDVAVDADGNVYVTGYSDRTWLGDANTPPLNPHAGDSEHMFALKLDAAGAYEWHTFYQPGRAHAIALDGAGNVMVTGYAAGEWGTPLHSAADSGHLVVLSLAADGDYRWHTYYGGGAGAGDEAGYGIAVDDLGNVYATGTATYAWEGDSGQSPVAPFNGDEGYATEVVVLSLTGTGAYRWHTFAGAGGVDDAGHDIAWGGGHVSVAGYSDSTWGSPRHAHAGERDILVLQLSGDGQRRWHTFHGAPASDAGRDIAVEAGGDIYVAGWSSGAWLGEGNAAPGHPYSGAGLADSVVVKLDGSGAYRRHTFYGDGGTDDYATGIALDGDGSVFVTGTSASSWLGDGGAAPLDPHSGDTVGGDGFVLKLFDRTYSVFLPLAISPDQG